MPADLQPEKQEILRNNRRKFIGTVGLVAAVSAVGGFPLAASEPVESAAERKVSKVISRYGKCVGIRREIGQPIEFKVQVKSQRHFEEVFDPRDLPFERIYVDLENTLKFKCHGAEFKIVNIA